MHLPPLHINPKNKVLLHKAEYLDLDYPTVLASDTSQKCISKVLLRIKGTVLMVTEGQLSHVCGNNQNDFMQHKAYHADSQLLWHYPVCIFCHNPKK